MNRLLAKTIQKVVPPCSATKWVDQLLQRLRRRTFRIFLNPGNGYFSQAGQDKFLNEVIFKGKRGGAFVEIGAAEGIALSNTYFFERELGWSGVCVEPQPKAFRKLAAARKCRCVQACVTDFSGAGAFLAVDGVPLLSGLVSKYDPRHLERIRREVAASGSRTQELEVHCCTFEELMEQSGLSAVDYLSVDTEGGELDLLMTIDFARFPINVISVENSFADGRFEATMNKNDYELVAVIGDDDIYLRRESTTSSQ